MALFEELAKRCLAAGARELHLITRYQDETTGKSFDFTADARKLFGELTFEQINQVPFDKVAEQTRPSKQVLGLKPGQMYMVANVADVAAAARR
eukprot:3053016-Prymnesium_polylepis.1